MSYEIIKQLFESGKDLTSREHIDVIEKYGFIGRLMMENHLPLETTLDEIKQIESSIRSAIMKYALEMLEYAPRRKIEKNE